MIYKPTFTVEKHWKWICDVELSDVRYLVDPIGEISSTVDINNTVYAEFRYAQRTLFKSGWTEDIVVNTDILQVRDKFQVYFDETNKTEYWVLLSRIDPPNDSIIAIRCQPIRCPVCGSDLFSLGDKVCCVNAECPAKFIATIRKFLCCATREDWGPVDFHIVGTLVDQGLVSRVVHLYRLDFESIDQLDIYNERVIHEFLLKLKRTLGTVSIGAYLNSLNIPHSKSWYLNETAIDNKFDRIQDFIDWIEQVCTCLMDEVMHYHAREEIYMLMSEDTFRALNDYFTYDTNVDIVEELEEIELFNS